MAWTDPIDAYCERLGAGLLGEPANALSNLAFLAAAVALWRLQSRLRAGGREPPRDIRLLSALVFLVAIGSTLFHTLALRWTGLLDTLLILLYSCAFLYSFLHHAVRTPAWVALGVAGAFACISFAFSRLFPPGVLNGSTAYIPNLIGLLAVTAWLTWHHAPASRALGLGSVVFCISLTLRTLDQEICVRFPLGTHFVWHLLNGLLLWIVSREMLLGRYAIAGEGAPTRTPKREAARRATADEKGGTAAR
jgi:Ceramidase